MRNRRRICLQILIVIFVVLILASYASAAPDTGTTPNTSSASKDLLTVDAGAGKISFNPQNTTTTVQLLLMLTVLSIAPSILIMMTSFTRIIIILSFLRNALGTQQMPPNQVLIGLALFLTLFIMAPVGDQLYKEAYKPLSTNQIKSDVALKRAEGIMKTFMLKQLRKSSEKDLTLFVNLAKIKTPVKPEDLPMRVVIPAFLLNELTVAFQMGFLIFLPFLVIDMVVSSTLMSMGMMMLPPVMISLPFKILLFIMVDGWALIVQSIVGGFVT